MRCPVSSATRRGMIDTAMRHDRAKE